MFGNNLRMLAVVVGGFILVPGQESKSAEAAAAPASSLDALDGDWAGAMRLDGMYFSLVAHLSKTANGYTETIDAPLRGQFGLPLSNIRATDDTAHFELHHQATGDVIFDGTLDGGLISGGVGQTLDVVQRAGSFVLVRLHLLDEPELAEYVGDFEVERLGRVRVSTAVSPSANLLEVFSEMLGDATVLFPVAPDEFVIGLDPADAQPIEARVRYQRDADGNIAGFALSQAGQKMKATRIVETFTIDSAPIETVTQRMLEQRNVPSYSLGIVRGDDLVYEQYLGVIDVESQRPATAETLYQLGSITKVFTATLLMILRDEGRVSLDDPVTALLPDDVRLSKVDPAQRSRITLRRLATHTAGLPRDPDNLQRVNGAKMPYTIAQLYDTLPRTVQVSPAGANWLYSNLGYGLLGHALSRAADMPFEALVSDRLLEPLEMTDTAIALTDAQLERFAMHYWQEDESRQPRPRWVYGEVSGNGGLSSNVRDMAKFISFQFRTGLTDLEPLVGDSLREMHTPQQLRQGYRQTIGVGWWIDNNDQYGTIISHGGEVDGHSSHLAFSPQHKVGVIVFANLGGDTAVALGDWLIKEVIEQTRSQTGATNDQAAAFYFSRNWGDAAWAYGRLARANPGNGQAQYRSGLSLLHLRRFDEARAAYLQAIENQYGPASAHYNLAAIASLLHDRERALKHLEAALGLGYRDLTQIEGDTDLHALRDDPGFEALLDRLRTEHTSAGD